MGQDRQGCGCKGDEIVRRRGALRLDAEFQRSGTGFGAKPLLQALDIDKHSLMGAVAYFLDLIAGADLEFDARSEEHTLNSSH